MGIRTKLSSMGYNGETVWDEKHTAFMINIGNNSTFELNIVAPNTYINPISIDWGDGTIEDYTSGIPKHTYSNGGNYKIIVSSETGRMPYFTFSGDDYITKILTPLMECYNGDVIATDFSKYLRWCGKLEFIPRKLFIKNSGITDFSEAFSMLYRVFDTVSIPNDLFAYTPNVISFNNCFYNTDLTGIPEGLFDNCINATNFTGVFYNSNVNTIPKGLFDNCVNAESFSLCFAVTNIDDIPEGLFDNCINATNFTSCFYDTNINSIPEGLFKNCVKAEFFSGTFNNCTSLVSIPEGLFDNCINASLFNNCFNTCSSLTSVPQNLFNNLDNITNVQSCFNNCKNINSNIPPVWTKSSITISTSYCSSCYNAINWLEAPFSFGGPTSLTLNVTPDDSIVQFTFAGDTYNIIQGNTAYTADKIINYNVSKDNYRTKAGSVESGNYTKDINLVTASETLTINVEPANATVILTDESNIEYTTNTYIFGLGETIKYTVKADGYLDKIGSITISGNTTINVSLTQKITLINAEYPFDKITGDFTNFVDNNNFIYNETYKAITSGPSSYGVSNGTSYGYIPFTTDNNTYTLDITGYISSESSFDFGGLYLGTAIYKPTQSQAKSKIGDGKGDYIFSLSGVTAETKYTKILEPDTNYYLNAFYVKDSSSNVNLDRLFIKNIDCYYTSEDKTFRQLTINTIQEDTTVIFVTSDNSIQNGNTVVFDTDTFVQYIIYSEAYGYRIGNIFVDNDITLDLDLSKMPEQGLILLGFSPKENQAINNITAGEYLPFDTSILVPEAYPVVITGLNNDTEADIIFVGNNSGNHEIDFSIPQDDIDNVEIILGSADGSEDNLYYNLTATDIYQEQVNYENSGTGSISGIYNDLSSISSINATINNNETSTVVNYSGNTFYTRHYFYIYNNGKTYKV